MPEDENNPFDESEDIAGSGEENEAEELNEVDATDADDEREEVEAGGEEKPKAKGAKKVVGKKANARPAVPEGYIAPVAFAKVLTEKLQKDGKLAEDEFIPPQMIYSYIKNSQGGKDPLPIYEAGGRQNLLKLEEALAWWERKDQRVAERAANKGKKAAKADATKDQATEAEEAEQATEAE